MARDLTPLPLNFLALMARQEAAAPPAWRARRAEERRQRALRRDALIARYGSREAGWAPCEREKLLRAAVADWRIPQAAPHGRWTKYLDGVHVFDEPTARVRAAIATAYPLPTTFAEAQAEHAYWTARRDDMRDLHDDQLAELIDDPLDGVARVRADMVRDLVMHELPTATLADLHARFAIMQDSEIDEPEMAAALLRDLTAMLKMDEGPWHFPRSSPDDHRGDERVAHDDDLRCHVLVQDGTHRVALASKSSLDGEGPEWALEVNEPAGKDALAFAQRVAKIFSVVMVEREGQP